MSRRTILALIIIFAIILGLKTSEVYASEIDISAKFKDANLRSAILELAKEATGEENKKQILESDIDKIVQMPGGTSLKLANKGITDLSGIEVFAGKGITWIFLDWNELTDLSQLSSLTELTKVSFSGNQISDLTPLSSLENLRNITAINNNIESLEPLTNLTNIEYICLDGNKLNSIDEISNWTNLKEISIANNLIETIPNLENSQNIEKINLMGNKITSLVGVANLQSLTELKIDNNLLSTLEGIENFNNLQILSCSNNEITDIEPLVQLSKLQNLNLNANQIRDISCLENNLELKYLYLDNNNIMSFDSIAKLNNLSKYTVYNQNISVEIKEKLVSNYVLVPLPELYTNLYNNNSILHIENLMTEVEGSQNYEITNENTQIKLLAEDLEKGTIIVKVTDGENTYLNYQIDLDRQPPVIIGVENNQVYYEPVVITSEDKDIEEIILLKNGEQLNYTLGQEISDSGKYILKVKDYVGNETTINFEISTEFNENEQGYIIQDNYITGIKGNTLMKNFKEILNANIDFDIYRSETQVSEEKIVATGDILSTALGNEYYLIVRADGNKDGLADITDLLYLKRYLLLMHTFDEYSMKAMNLNSDNGVDITDLLLLKRLLIE